MSLNWFDWLIIWSALLVIHWFFFQPALTTLGFPTFGPWLWGFDKSATQYLLFLLLAGFVYWRARRTRLTRWNLGLFDDLTTSLLHAGKLEELADSYGLQARGGRGEHSPPGPNGEFDISNKGRIGASEVELVQRMIDGVDKLIDLEEKA